MRNLITSFLVILLFTTSCTDTQETGFLGDWEGTIEIISSQGEAIESETSATIISKGEFARECTVKARELSLTFIAQKNENFLIYKNTEVTNQLDTTVQTYITGNVELIGDTLIIFDHEVFVKQGSSVISSEDLTFEMKKKG